MFGESRSGSPPLKTLLSKTTPRGPRILTNTLGRPWTSDGFRTSWRKLCRKAKIENLTFHDLRGSAVTRLSLAGASPQQAAGVTGHSLADVGAILDRHYLGDRPALAETAIQKLEANEKRTNSQTDLKPRPYMAVPALLSH